MAHDTPETYQPKQTPLEKWIDGYLERRKHRSPVVGAIRLLAFVLILLALMFVYFEQNPTQQSHKITIEAK